MAKNKHLKRNKRQKNINTPQKIQSSNSIKESVVNGKKLANEPVEQVISKKSMESVDTKTLNIEIPKSSFLTDNDAIELKKMKDKFELRRKRADTWQKKMPLHCKVDELGQPVLDESGHPELIEPPGFLTDPSKKDERVEMAQKLRTLLKSRFGLSYIADAFLYNEYSAIDDVLFDRENFYNLAKDYYPSFTMDFKAKVGAEQSKIYSAEEKKISAVIDFFESGDYIGSKNSQAFQDAVSSIVDTAKFNSACRIEAEFLSDEFYILIEKLKERIELDLLITRAVELQNEVNRRKEACQTIEELMAGRKKSPNDLDR